MSDSRCGLCMHGLRRQFPTSPHRVLIPPVSDGRGRLCAAVSGGRSLLILATYAR